MLDLRASLDFYTDAGFSVAYARPEEEFAMLVRDGVALMLEGARGPGRRLGERGLERPLGRGMNLQIEVDDILALYRTMTGHGWSPVVELEERWYRVDEGEAGNRQFVVADPDGYLLRFSQDLGTRRGVINPS